MAEQKTEAPAPAAGAEKKVSKKKTKRNVPTGKCFIQSGFGNTIVTMTDLTGNTVCWSSAGMLGFKGSRKGTPFAAQMAAEDASRKALDAGMKQVDVFLTGPGAGREPAVRAIAASGLRVTILKDITPIPHNGCRPPKRRRI
jgi:small subunit ribosomal protein S11